MSDLSAVLLIFILIGAGATILSSFLNQKVLNSMNSSQKFLENQANSLPSNDIGDFLRQYGFVGKDEQTGYLILEFLANLLKVSPAKLAGNYPLSQLFRYSEERSLKNGQKVVIFEPFAYELIEGIAELCDKKLWEDKWKDTKALPCEEEEMIDFLMQMNIPDFLRFFVPLIVPIP